MPRPSRPGAEGERAVVAEVHQHLPEHVAVEGRRQGFGRRLETEGEVGPGGGEGGDELADHRAEVVDLRARQRDAGEGGELLGEAAEPLELLADAGGHLPGGVELLAAEQPLEARQLQARGGERRPHLVGVAAGGLLPAGEVAEVGQALAVARHGPRGVLDHAGDPADGVAAAVADLQVLVPVRQRDQAEAQALQPGVQTALAEEVEGAGHGEHGEHGGEQDGLPAPRDPASGCAPGCAGG